MAPPGDDAPAAALAVSVLAPVAARRVQSLPLRVLYPEAGSPAATLTAVWKDLLSEMAAAVIPGEPFLEDIDVRASTDDTVVVTGSTPSPAPGAQAMQSGGRETTVTTDEHTVELMLAEAYIQLKSSLRAVALPPGAEA